MDDNTVTLYEVGPRDGLQSLGAMVDTETKVALVEALTRAGFKKIEVTSFVSPRAVPQLADAEAVMAGITRAPGVTYAALTPNLRGYARARSAGVNEVSVFASSSEGFSRANLNCSIAESLDRFQPILAAAKTDGMPVRGYLSTVIACPFDGLTPPQTVARLAKRLLAMGCHAVSLGDTIGAGDAGSLHALLDVVLRTVPAARLAGHFHDTGGTALAMIEAGLERGLRVFDGSVGGLGGCPYAPGASGNVDTRAALIRISQLGYRTDVDLHALAEAETIASSILRADRI